MTFHFGVNVARVDDDDDDVVAASGGSELR